MTIKPLTFALLASLLILVLPQIIQAAERSGEARLIARPNVQVSSVLVTLGDLFENAGAKSEIAVFRAPAPGKTGYIRAGRLMEAARKHGLEWDNPDALPRINIARQSRVISPEDITASIRKKLIETSAIQDDEGSLNLRFSKSPGPIHLPLDSSADFDVGNVNYDANSGRFTAVLNATGADGRPVKRIYYSGTAIRTLKVPVLSHPLDRGSVIGAEDITTMDIPLRNLNRAPLRHVSEMVGMAVKRNIRANTVIFKRDIEPPRIVRRNALVRIIFKTPGLALTTKGKALASGALGDVIDVLNVRSKRIIQVTVIAKNTVSPVADTAVFIGRTAMAAKRYKGGSSYE